MRCFQTTFTLYLGQRQVEWYNCHLRVPYLFQFLGKVEALVFLLHSFDFKLWSAGTAKSTIF